MTGPTVRRRILGSELRAIREAADVSRGDMRRLLGCSDTRSKYLESGRNVVTKPELLVWLQRCDAMDKFDVLEEIRLGANQRGWWSTDRLPEWLGLYVGLEHGATSVRCFETLVVPGLLQTEAYARELHTVVDAHTDEQIEKRVHARMGRQARLESGELRLTAVVTRAVLDSLATDGGVGMCQLKQLTEQSHLPNVDLRVLPPAGVHPGTSGPFSLLSFPGEALADVAWQEYAVGGHLIEADQDVAYLARIFDRLRRVALDQDASRAMMAGLIDNPRG